MPLYNISICDQYYLIGKIHTLEHIICLQYVNIKLFLKIKLWKSENVGLRTVYNDDQSFIVFYKLM